MHTLTFRFGSIWLACIALLLTAVAYWPGLHGGFFFDDHPNILDNAGLRIEGLSVDALQRALSSGISGQFGRPVSQLSFALNYHFSGFDPFAFKLTNLVIHCLNGILVYFLARRLLPALRRQSEKTDSGVFAALVSFIWLIHPIQLSSVLYVVQRMTSLSAFFLLIGVLLHITARAQAVPGRKELAWLALAWFLFWPLSILSKESGILLPGFIAAYELIVRRSERGRLDLFGRVVLSLVIALPVILALYLASPAGKWLFDGYMTRGFSLSERLMTESRVVWEYFRLIFLPDLRAFSIYHDDLVISSGLLRPWTTLPAMLGLLALAALAFLKRQQYPLFAFGIAWFFIGHTLESTFIPLELMHEHRNYVPLLGLCFLPVELLDYWAARPGFKKAAAAALLGVLIAYTGLLTALRANMFANDRIRTQIEAQHHPDSARANYEAGRTLAGAVDHDRSNTAAFLLAKKHFERTGELDPNYKMGFLGLLVLDCGMSQTFDPHIIDEMARRLNESPWSSDDSAIMSEISKMSIAGDLCLTRSAIDTLFAAALSNPRVASNVQGLLYSWHADYAWLHEKDMTAAKESLGRTLALMPGEQSSRLKWAQLIFISGEHQEARRLLLELDTKRLSQDEKKTLHDLLVALNAVKK